MPIFKSTYNILKAPWEDEVFNPNWMDSNTIVLPPKKDWDYSRDLQIEDVDIWEVIYETSGPNGLYASWSPYAEFYMLLRPPCCGGLTTYYGKGAQQKVQEEVNKLGWPIMINKIWVDPEKMWLYE